MNAAGRTTRDNILSAAAKGASEGQINAALSLQEEVDSLRRKKEAQEAATAAAEQSRIVGASLIASLHQEQAELGMTSDQLARYRAAQAGASEEDIRRAAAIQLDIKAVKDKSAADALATAAIEHGIKSGKSLVAGLKATAAAHGMSATQARIYQAAQAGANREDLEAAMVLARRERAQRTMDAEVARSVQRTRELNSAQNSSNRTSGIGIEVVRGLEDAVAGYSNNGIKGMILAGANNVNQIGAMTGGVAGLAISIGSVAALVGVSLIPKLIEWSKNTAEVEAANVKLSEQNKRIHDEEMRRLNQRFDLQFSREKSWREFQNATRKQDPLNKRDDVAAGVQEQLSAATDAQVKARAQMNLLLKQNPLAGGAIEQVKDRDKGTMLGLAGSFFDERLGGESDVEFARRERFTKEANEARKQFQELQEVEKKASEEKQTLKDQLAIQEKQFEAQQFAEKIRERARMQNALDAAQREQEEETAREIEQGNERRLNAQKQLASKLQDEVGKLSPGVGEQNAIKAKQDEIRKLREQGLITGAEAGILNANNKPKTDPVAGSPEAVRFGTQAAYSGAIRAMKEAERGREAESQKKIAEQTNTILERLITAVKDAEKLEIFGG